MYKPYWDTLTLINKQIINLFIHKTIFYHLSILLVVSNVNLNNYNLLLRVLVYWMGSSILYLESIMVVWWG